MSTLHPRTEISVLIQVMSDDGSLLAAALNGTCLALIDAGIPLHATVAAITCAYTKDYSFVLDPDAEEQRSAAAVFTFALSSGIEDVKGRVLVSHTWGSFDERQYFYALKTCQLGITTLLSFFRKAIEKQYTTTTP
eukprot:TRINITY_DN8631_c0_g1_i1.p1 TRINITY_DN8631_c0_g1~~TRINITY_DN8631_c0_g1_i1.p1  ORF type:complete len:136 (-),score=22.04 TRINITY_DN8631_c0_g1_i1:55-462(-)